MCVVVNNVRGLGQNNWHLGYWTLKRKTLSSAVLISCYLTQHSCLRWSGSVVHCRSVFQVRKSIDRYMLVITARVFSLFEYPQFVWSTDRDCRSQWPRGLKCRFAAARPLRLWVRIPPGAWLFVCCDCYVMSGRGLCDKLIPRIEESYRLWWVVVCDLETLWMRRCWPTGGCCAKRKKN